MRKSREAKAETHDVIVREAARLFRERGIEQTSVADVMQSAKLTHGGFYRHFKSKDDLVAAAMAQAVGEVLTELQGHDAAKASRAALDKYTAKYLSDGHVRQPAIGCPIAALAVEAGRIGGVVAAATSDSISRLIGAIAAQLPGPRATARERAAITFATLVGAVVLARATNSATIGQEVLEACRKRLAPDD